jgi:hypothetical protein
MLSLIFLAYAVVHLSVYFWGWRLWATNGRPTALFIVLFGATLLWYDNFRIGIGRFIGAGDTLYDLSVPAFAWHWALLPLLIIAAGSVARLADLQWARNRWVMAGFCILAVALSAMDTPKIFHMQLHIACLADTVRYTTNVPASQLCPGDLVAHAEGAGGPFAAIVTNIVVLGVGIALWAKRSWPWLAFGAGMMFLAAGGFARSKWALPVANLGEIFINTSFVITCAHFARLRATARAP